MSQQEILMIEKLLRETIENEKVDLTTSCVDESKRRGVLEGAKTGLNALERLRDGVSHEVVFSSLNSRINQAIYSLLVAEAKYERQSDSMLRCEIAYCDNLTTTLQLLRTRLSVLVNNMPDSVY